MCEEEEGETTKFKILGTASVNDSHVDTFYSGIRLFFTFYLTKLAKMLMLGFIFPDTEQKDYKSLSDSEG